jgi:hypothetical protein
MCKLTCFDGCCTPARPVHGWDCVLVTLKDALTVLHRQARNPSSAASASLECVPTEHIRAMHHLLQSYASTYAYSGRHMTYGHGRGGKAVEPWDDGGPEAIVYRRSKEGQRQPGGQQLRRWQCRQLRLQRDRYDGES